MRPGLSILLGIGALVAVSGCGERSYSRAEVIGLVVPIEGHQIPADQVVMVPLPPMPGVVPDTTDGTVLCAVNQREMWQDTGMTLPSWEPRRTQPEETDPHLARLMKLREDLDAVRRTLDRIFAAASDSADGTTITTERKALARLLSPADWKKLTTGVVTLTTGISSYVQEIQKPDEPLAGGRALKQRSDQFWAGMLPAADQLVAAVDGISRGGSLPLAGDRPEYQVDWRERMGILRKESTTLRELIAVRDGPAVLPHLRLLQRLLDDLEMAPVAGAAFGLEALAELPFTREQRDESRERLARARLYLVQLAAIWADAQAKLLTDGQQRPILVWEPATRLD